MPLVRFLRVVPVCGNILCLPNRVGQIHCSQEKSAFDSTSQPGWVARGIRLSFSPKHNHWSSVLKPNICWRIAYIGLIGAYLQHVISTFNTCSQGPTHLSSIDTGEGYNLGGVGLPNHTSRPSQMTALRFPPKGPTRGERGGHTGRSWRMWADC
jgi:hypothetical protein